MEREKILEPREWSPPAALGSSLCVPKGTAGHGPAPPRPFPAGPAPTAQAPASPPQAPPPAARSGR